MSLTDMKAFWLGHFNISVTYGGSPLSPADRRGSARVLCALHEHMFADARSLLNAGDREHLDILLDEMPNAVNWNAFRHYWHGVRDDHDSVLFFYGRSDGRYISLRDNDVQDPEYDLSTANLMPFFRKRRGGSASIFLLLGCRTAPSPDPLVVIAMKRLLRSFAPVVVRRTEPNAGLRRLLDCA
jgi:hypothetical protein